MEQDVFGIQDEFGDLRDPRSRTPASPTDMLVVVVCAILSGADIRMAIQIWGEAKLCWLRRYLLLDCLQRRLRAESRPDDARWCLRKEGAYRRRYSRSQK
ncbi:transposase family protein [Paraburkholderia domus]|uniref:transposase family protein n=1 Tax=Paraburkholderia domus TaxID=2793075 RepID=UPI001B07A484|nr:transposase family protein [Paraburkholderia domus]CAE6765480.1 hypothetical protein R75483_03751 [Paraburkholderia domus]